MHNPSTAAAEDVGIGIEPEADQTQPEDSDFEDVLDSLSSSRSSLVSNAPSVQHFNISVRLHHTYPLLHQAV